MVQSELFDSGSMGLLGHMAGTIRRPNHNQQ